MQGESLGLVDCLSLRLDYISLPRCRAFPIAKARIRYSDFVEAYIVGGISV